MKKPECPQCKSLDLKHEGGDRYQCRTCNWRCRVDDQGTAKSLVNIFTAKASRRRS